MLSTTQTISLAILAFAISTALAASIDGHPDEFQADTPEFLSSTATYIDDHQYPTTNSDTAFHHYLLRRNPPKRADTKADGDFKIKPNTAFRKLNNAFSERQGKSLEQTRFLFDGQRVQPDREGKKSRRDLVEEMLFEWDEM